MFRQTSGTGVAFKGLRPSCDEASTKGEWGGACLLPYGAVHWQTKGSFTRVELVEGERSEEHTSELQSQ